MKPSIVTIYVIKKDQEEFKYLLLRRCGTFLKENWQPPGGKIEDGETASDAALRELFEETGLIPDRFFYADYLEIFFNQRTDTIYQSPAFAAFIDDDSQIVKLSAIEHDEYKWLNFTETLYSLEFEGQRKILFHITKNFVENPPNSRFCIDPKSNPEFEKIVSRVRSMLKDDPDTLESYEKVIPYLRKEHMDKQKTTL